MINKKKKIKRNRLPIIFVVSSTLVLLMYLFYYYDYLHDKLRKGIYSDD